MYGYCYIGVVPIRKDSNSYSEQVSQLLFGDIVSIEKEENGWLLIKTIEDNYEGFVDKRNLIVFSQEDNQELFAKNEELVKNYSVFLTSSLLSNIEMIKNNKKTLIPIPFCSKIIRKTYSINDTTFTIDASHLTKKLSFNLINLEKIAKTYLNCPYQWGGKSVFGIDCSGFTQNVFRFFDIYLNRDASQQALQGKTIENINDIQTGDLCFFDNKNKHITHVGIYLKNNMIIHSSGRVRIDTIDTKGIFDKENNEYSHSLCLIKRML